MENLQVSAHCLLLILGVYLVPAILTSEDGTENGEIPFPSTVYNPVNYVTINTCCNETDSDARLQEQLNTVTSLLTDLISRLENGELCCGQEIFRDCYEIQQSGVTESGVYGIHPDGSHPFKVYCDMDTDGGGWTVFQRRENGNVDFYRDWQDYKNGFGSVDSEHWLGNENLYYLSHQKTYELRVDLADFEEETRYAKYAAFLIGAESDNYRLTLGVYIPGDAGNSMAICNGEQFSTYDADHDDHTTNCAERYKGGWWYESCHHSNLNGLYLSGTHESYADGVEWYHWKGHHYSLKLSEMKVRPI